MDWLALIIAIVIPQIAGAIGAVSTASSVKSWYRTQRKPKLSPPNWIFGPVWTTLYLLMGIASYLVWEAGKAGADVWPALTAYAVQLVFNTVWSLIFFGWRNPRLAFFELVVMWIAIVVTIHGFSLIDPVAAWLMAPYLCWVTFAGYLNFSIWKLNDTQSEGSPTAS